MHELMMAFVVKISDKDYASLKELGDKAGKLPEVYAQDKLNEMAKHDICMHLIAYRMSPECKPKGLDELSYK